jgi:hypothetical protein
MGKEAFVGTEKTREENYILWSMEGQPLLILVQLRKPLFIISSLVISDCALPVRVAI